MYIKDKDNNPKGNRNHPGSRISHKSILELADSLPAFRNSQNAAEELFENSPPYLTKLAKTNHIWLCYN